MARGSSAFLHHEFSSHNKRTVHFLLYGPLIHWTEKIRVFYSRGYLKLFMSRSYCHIS